MKYLFRCLLFALLIFPEITMAQICTNDSTGLIPIIDFGNNQYDGIVGGLYLNGSNNMPNGHRQAGINLDNSIQPLDVNGNPDPNGKIVMISVGMSNCRNFFGSFMQLSAQYANLNPNLVLINAAQGGKDINNILSPNTNYWTTSDNIITNAGYSINQVQAVWFEQATHITGIPAGEGIEHIGIVEQKFLDAFKIIKTQYPNVKQLFCSGRDYGGYNVSGGNPEPYAYWTNWAFKKLVLRQIAGDPDLSYTGTTPQVPWIAWADHIWADGKNPSGSGLTWICPTDYQSDGVHPSIVGREKFATKMVDFFKTDTTTTWYRQDSSTTLPCIELFLRVNLEGAYDTSANMMTGHLYSNAVLPAGQPYNLPPWNYQGTEGAGWTINDYPTFSVDWVLVSLRTTPDVSSEVYRAAGVLRQNGQISFGATNSNCHPGELHNNAGYYVVVEHRNHMGVMSATPALFNGLRLQYNFRNRDSYKTGTSQGQKLLKQPNVYGMYCGDMDQTDFPSYDINGQDKWLWVQNNGNYSDYNVGDMNLDNDVNGADRILWSRNSGVFSAVTKP